MKNFMIIFLTLIAIFIGGSYGAYWCLKTYPNDSCKRSRAAVRETQLSAPDTEALVRIVKKLESINETLDKIEKRLAGIEQKLGITYTTANGKVIEIHLQRK